MNKYPEDYSYREYDLDYDESDWAEESNHEAKYDEELYSMICKQIDYYDILRTYVPAKEVIKRFLPTLLRDIQEAGFVCDKEWPISRIVSRFFKRETTKRKSLMFGDYEIIQETMIVAFDVDRILISYNPGRIRGLIGFEINFKDGDIVAKDYYDNNNYKINLNEYIEELNWLGKNAVSKYKKKIIKYIQEEHKAPLDFFLYFYPFSFV